MHENVLETFAFLPITLNGARHYKSGQAIKSLKGQIKFLLENLYEFKTDHIQKIEGVHESAYSAKN